MRHQPISPNIISARNVDFYYKVQNVVLTIPYGKVTTYGHIAAFLGARLSARIVGYALNSVSIDDRRVIPCHRVVNRNGELSGKMHFETPYAMRDALVAEGIEFIGERVNLKKHLWIPDDSFIY